MNLCKLPLTIVISVAPAGCAITVPKPDTQFLAKPLKVRLVQTPFQDKEAIRSIVAQDLPKDSPEINQEISNAIEAAQLQAFTDMTSALATFPSLTVDGAPILLPSVLNGFPITDRNQPLAPEAAASLRATSGTDALLRFGITDYGLTPKAWRKGVVTFEVVSTLGIAAIAYARPATRAIAGAYLLQETIEETFEAYSGFWLGLGRGISPG